MAKKIPETEDDFIQMQQEAIRRVMDMQQRARATLEGAGMQIGRDTPAPVSERPSTPDPPRETQIARPVSQPVWNAPIAPSSYMASSAFGAGRPSPGPPPAEPEDPAPNLASASRVGHGSPNPPFGGIIPPLGELLPALHISLDREQIMLLMLIFLLYQDKGDRMLLLALAYIFLI